MASARPRIEVVDYNGLSPSSSEGDNEGICSCLMPDYGGGGGSGVGIGSGSGGSGLGSSSGNSANCLTFSVDILSTTEPEMEDITSNCLLNVQDTAAASSSTGHTSHPTMTAATSASASEQASPRSLSPKTVSKKKATKKVGSTSTSSAAAKRSKSFHTSSSSHLSSSGEAAATSITAPPPPSPRIIPRLQLPEDNETKSNNELFEQMPDADAGVPLPPQAPPKKRKRRKSIVNLLFPGPKGNSSSANMDTPKTPLLAPTPAPPSPSTLTTDSHGGQRLHFRRLSDFICRPNPNQTKRLAKIAAAAAAAQENQSSDPDSPPESPKSPESTFLGQLFPHRRRRSSVSHLDHTQQFHETKSIALEATRRRMSSFPPSDGDESAVILERIHYLSTLEADETSRAATPVSESTSPLKLLKKHLGLPGSASFNCSRWKSNVDVTRDRSDDEVMEAPAPKPKSKPKPSKSKSRDKSIEKNQDFESTSNSLFPPKRSVRRNSSPLLPDIIAFRQRHESAERDELNEGRNSKGCHVFPKRKIEDVPGIFIPQQSKKGQSNTVETSACAATDDSKCGRNSHFLGVKEEHGRRRRHSLSDPALLLKFNSPSKQTMMPTACSTTAAAAPSPSRPSWLANLTPRSPYANTSQAVLPFPRCCCFLSRRS